LQGTDKNLAELIQAGGETIHSETYKLNNSIWNMEEVTQQWQKSIVVPTYKKGDKTECSNYPGIKMSSTSLNILFNVVSKPSPYVDKITGGHQWVFWDLTKQISY
jgi:hypothetical protein